MKRGWLVPLGRTGSALLAMSLALITAAMIPPSTSGMRSMSMGSIQPEGYQDESIGACLPQMGLRISIETNGTFQLYITSMDFLGFFTGIRSWLNESFPGLNSSQIQDWSNNATVLAAFLEAHPEAVLASHAGTESLSVEFFPSKPTNVTLVIANPGSFRISVSMDVSILSRLVSKEQVSVPAGVLVASGLVLALPRAILSAKKQVRRG
jgi:hypothetical protein